MPAGRNPARSKCGKRTFEARCCPKSQICTHPENMKGSRALVVVLLACHAAWHQLIHAMFEKGQDIDSQLTAKASFRPDLDSTPNTDSSVNAHPAGVLWLPNASPSVHAKLELTLRSRLEFEPESPSVDAQPNDAWMHARPGSETEKPVRTLNCM